MCWKVNKYQSNEAEARNLENEVVSSAMIYRYICVQNNSSPTLLTRSINVFGENYINT